MKKNIILLLMIFCSLFFALTTMAAEVENNTSGPVILVNLLVIIVAGGVIYNIWVNFSGFGGLLGNAIKIIGVGVLALSINTIDEVIEGITGIGSSSLLGTGVVHDIFHSGLMLLGFLILGFGLSKLSQLVKAMK